jgi:hypothetical protein
VSFHLESEVVAEGNSVEYLIALRYGVRERLGGFAKDKIDTEGP